MEPITLVGWLPPRELSPNARVHHMARARATSATKLYVTVALLAEAERAGWTPQPQGGPRRRLTVVMRRPRLLDADNAFGACKAVIDAVKELGYLYDDNLRNAALVVEQERVRRTASRRYQADSTRVGTVLTLEELDGETEAPTP